MFHFFDAAASCAPVAFLAVTDQRWSFDRAGVGWEALSRIDRSSCVGFNLQGFHSFQCFQALTMRAQELAESLRGLMKVAEAADFCGVTTKTMRNWDRSGRLVPLRHPVTRYRYYSREQLEDFIARAKAEYADE